MLLKLAGPDSGEHRASVQLILAEKAVCNSSGADFVVS